MIPEGLQDCLLKGPTLVGVGNLLCGDDGFGPWVIQLLRGRICLPLLDGGSAPENITGPLRRCAPSEIIILDAIILDDAEPGSLYWILSEQLETISDSTHGPSLDLFVKFAQEELDANAYILGTLPVQLGWGTAMSPLVKRTAEQLAAFIVAHTPGKK